MRRFALPFLLAAALLGGCRKETPEPPPAQPKPSVSSPQPGGRLVRRMEADVNTLNYVLHTEEEERQVLAYLYDPLIALDQNLNPIPAVVAKWEVSADGLVYTLHLDPRANFSDGMPVKASDVVFTLNRIMDEESQQFSGWFEALDREQTQAIDDRAVRVVFKEARVPQLLSFNISVMPEHVYGKGEFEKIEQVVGTGPYVLKKRERGRSILVERRENYWREKPLIDSVLFRVISDDKVAWNAMMRGELDASRINNEIWSREKDKPEVRSKIAFHDIWTLSYNCIIWNVEDPLFNDPRVRRALAMSFDRRSIIEKLYYGQARPVTGPFTPEQWAYNEEVLPIGFNPQAAAALLASAGWTDGNQDGLLERGDETFTFTLLIPAQSGITRDQALVFQDALKSVGVKLEIAAMDGAAFFDHILNRNFQAAYTAWVNEPDPDPHSLFHSSQKAPEGLNIAGYVSAEADELIEQGRTEFDPARRRQIYHQLHDVIARDQPYLFTVQVAFKWAVTRRVQSVRVSKGLGLFLWHPGPFAWWLRR